MSLELYRSVLADKQSQIRNLQERKIAIEGRSAVPNEFEARIARLDREVTELKAIVAHLERVASLSARS